MKRYYTINYKAIGGNMDVMSVWSDSLSNAIKEFVSIEFTTSEITYHYNESAIRVISNNN